MLLITTSKLEFCHPYEHSCVVETVINVAREDDEIHAAEVLNSPLIQLHDCDLQPRGGHSDQRVGRGG